MAGSNYTVSIDVVANNQASTELQDAKTDLENLDQAAEEAGGADGGLATLESGLEGLGSAIVALGLVTFAENLASVALELGNLGEEITAQEDQLVAWAGGVAEANNAIAAMDATLGGTLSYQDKLAAANKFLSMGLADNAEEAAQMAEMAVLLGDKTKSAGDRVEDFGLLLANQSVLRLDNFGISSGEAREKINALMEAEEDLTREQAFLNVVLAMGSEKVKLLKDAGVEAVTSSILLQNAWSDLRAEIGKKLAPATSAIQTGLAQSLQMVTGWLQGGSEDPATQLRGLNEQLAVLQAQKAEINENPLRILHGSQAAQIDKQIADVQARIDALKAEMAAQEPVEIPIEANVGTVSEELNAQLTVGGADIAAQVEEQLAAAKEMAAASVSGALEDIELSPEDAATISTDALDTLLNAFGEAVKAEDVAGRMIGYGNTLFGYLGQGLATSGVETDLGEIDTTLDVGNPLQTAIESQWKLTEKSAASITQGALDTLLTAFDAQVGTDKIADQMYGVGDMIFGYMESGVIGRAQSSTALRDAIYAMVNNSLAAALEG